MACPEPTDYRLLTGLTEIAIIALSTLMNVSPTDKTIPAFTARRQFGRILHDVEMKGAPVVVERHGEPVAAVVPMRIYEQWKRRHEALFAKLRLGADRANLSEKEANALAAKAIRRVRHR
jgi:prevent-host-death family protein